MAQHVIPWCATTHTNASQHPAACCKSDRIQVGSVQVISSVVPRPIGFMSTVSEKGKVNLSPYSYFGAMGHDPPMVRVPRRCTLLLLSLIHI